MNLSGNSVRRANPLFNHNRLKLGVFFANIGGGARPTLADDRTTLNWPSVIEIARMSDLAGVEAFIPLATWSARNRDSDFTKYSYEPWTWAAGIAQATDNICVFTTAQVPIFPPVVAAKLAVTIDHIANGRFAINVVCGHAGQAPEGLVGAPQLNHDEWYEYADEWIEILDRLWCEPDVFDYSGRFFELKGAGSYPKPLQQPRPPIMNAGNSDVGQRWAARHSDMMFTAAPTGDYEAVKAKVDRIRGIAAEYGREVEVWMSSSVVVRPTQREAFEYLDYYAVDHADVVALASQQRDSELPARLQAMPAAERSARLQQMVAGSFNMQILVGTPEQIVDRLIALSKAGVDGLNMTFVNYQDELQRVVGQVIPLMEQAGLRLPFTPHSRAGLSAAG